MGRRRKERKSIHPSDAYRRRERKRMLRKNKADRDELREYTLKQRNPASLIEEIKRINTQEKQGLLNDKQVKRRKVLIQAHSRAVREYKAQKETSEIIKVKGLQTIISKKKQNNLTKNLKSDEENESLSDSSNFSTSNFSYDSDSDSDTNSDFKSDFESNSNSNLKNIKIKSDLQLFEEGVLKELNQYDDDQYPFFPPGLKIPPELEHPPGILPKFDPLNIGNRRTEMLDDGSGVNDIGVAKAEIINLDSSSEKRHNFHIKDEMVLNKHLNEQTNSRKKFEKDTFDPMNPRSSNYLNRSLPNELSNVPSDQNSQANFEAIQNLAMHPEQLRRYQQRFGFDPTSSEISEQNQAQPHMISGEQKLNDNAEIKTAPNTSSHISKQANLVATATVSKSLSKLVPSSLLIRRRNNQKSATSKGSQLLTPKTTPSTQNQKLSDNTISTNQHIDQKSDFNFNTNQKTSNLLPSNLSSTPNQTTLTKPKFGTRVIDLAPKVDTFKDEDFNFINEKKLNDNKTENKLNESKDYRDFMSQISELVD